MSSVKVKDIVGAIIAGYDHGEAITIDTLIADNVANGREIDRSDILSAMKALEADGIGAVCIGRRKHPTRFIKGGYRQEVKLNDNLVNQINDIIETKPVGEAIILEDVLANIGPSNRQHVSEILKKFEADGKGCFLIGRRGTKTRFIVGVSRDMLKVKPNSIVTPNDINAAKIAKTGEYNYYNGVITVGKPGMYSSLEEVIAAAGVNGVTVQDVMNDPNFKTKSFCDLSAIATNSNVPQFADEDDELDENVA